MAINLVKKSDIMLNELNDLKVGNHVAIIANHTDTENGYVDYVSGIIVKISNKLIAVDIGSAKPIVLKKQRIVSVYKYQNGGSL